MSKWKQNKSGSGEWTLWTQRVVTPTKSASVRLQTCRIVVNLRMATVQLKSGVSWVQDETARQEVGAGESATGRDLRHSAGSHAKKTSIRRPTYQ